MNVKEFEDAVWATEGIRIAIRATANREVENYDYKQAAPHSWRTSELLQGRIRPLVGDLEVVVIQGNGEQPRGNVILRTLRASYHRT